MTPEETTQLVFPDNKAIVAGKRTSKAKAIWLLLNRDAPVALADIRLRELCRAPGTSPPQLTFLQPVLSLALLLL